MRVLNGCQVVYLITHLSLLADLCIHNDSLTLDLVSYIFTLLMEGAHYISDMT